MDDDVLVSSSGAAMSTKWPHGEPSNWKEGDNSSGTFEDNGETGAGIVITVELLDSESSTDWASSTSDKLDFGRVKLGFFLRGCSCSVL
jgi:hypothetical protein